MAIKTRRPTDEAPRTGRPPHRRTTVAVYESYGEAERAVDFLSDHGFPVERASIVGRDLRWVEQVTGRVTSGRAALQGALTGAVVGLLVGWLFGLFDWFNPVVAAGWLALDGLWFGALLGGLAGLLAHAMTGGRRDFASFGSVTADKYEVQVDDDLVEEAAGLLTSMNAPDTRRERADRPGEAA
jgi:Heat induced stress protein YflT domain